VQHESANDLLARYFGGAYYHSWNALKQLRCPLPDVCIIDDDRFFETPPMAGPLPDDVHKPNRTRKRAK